MEKLENYRNCIQQLLTEYANMGSQDDEIQIQTIFDTQRDHYQVVYAGWKNRKRHYGCVLHLDIYGDKIWIQYDGTEVGIANKLIDLGVPKKDIVLGFHEPFIRQYDGFAIN